MSGPMLSRHAAATMECHADTPRRWDIFCTVIDNFGDIGVCWRLARQLAAEHACAVRLWVDDLAAFGRICPEIAPDRSAQSVAGVDIRRWDADFPEIEPGDVVVEAFACHLPERFVAAMAGRASAPVWVNLDYLSAEAWVEGCHALPSPHPRLPLVKYFFFPGFTDATGGLLRERDLEAQRRAFVDSPAQQVAFWAGLGQTPPAAEALKISLFAYENPAVVPLLERCAQGERPVCCLAPLTRTRAALAAFAGHPLAEGEIFRRGALEIRALPFVRQEDYDRLLWCADLNFVRGEDSFVRAQWAEKPFVWHIYQQAEEAHRIKLEAFLERYCAGLTAAVGDAVRGFNRAWNDGRMTDEEWRRWTGCLPEIDAHAQKWGSDLKKKEDLCSALVRFCRSKL